MPVVTYEREFPYPRDSSGNPFPILPVQIEVAGDAIETHAYLDSGAEYSLFSAAFARVLGLDLQGGARRTYSLANRQRLDATVREVRLTHPDLGSFSLQLGFSDETVRNLLGRDFFNLIQIGFREQYSTFYITPRP